MTVWNAPLTPALALCRPPPPPPSEREQPVQASPNRRCRLRRRGPRGRRRRVGQRRGRDCCCEDREVSRRGGRKGSLGKDSLVSRLWASSSGQTFSCPPLRWARSFARAQSSASALGPLLAPADSSYPAALKTHQHTAKAYLPVPVARALHADPELIQRAVEGFYVRDPAQLRVGPPPLPVG